MSTQFVGVSLLYTLFDKDSDFVCSGHTLVHMCHYCFLFDIQYVVDNYLQLGGISFTYSATLILPYIHRHNFDLTLSSLRCMQCLPDVPITYSGL